ncbi:EamA family transporter [Pseudomonas syringae]|uniref:DMT family transporter n=1 Tax=Pseudomonas syringae TaxID=317 RepID=UPI001F3B3EB6|nr:DMT family transporter [Pseudomonas syringae]MCF5706109.1 EamA family transporter [Pseudomonas syringae]
MVRIKFFQGESLGLLLVLSYVILSSTKDIILERLLSISNPADYLVIVFGIATVIYWLVGKVTSDAPSAHFSPRAVLPAMLALNIVTLGNWFGLYYSLKYLSAPAVSVLYAGVIPVATLIINAVIRNTIAPRREILCAAGLFIIAFYWFAESLSVAAYQHTVLGLMFLLGSACTIASTTVLSKKLSDSHVPTAVVMSHRFYLLLIVAFALASPLSSIMRVLFDNILIVLFVAVGGTVVSLWALQKGIEKTDPMTTNLVVSAGPVITLALYPIISGGASLSISTYFAAAAVTLISMTNAFYKARSNMMIKP